MDSHEPRHEGEREREEEEIAALQARLAALEAERAEIAEQLRLMGFFKNTGHPRELVHAVRNALNTLGILREVVRTRQNAPPRPPAPPAAPEE